MALLEPEATPPSSDLARDLQSQRDVHYEVKVPSALTKTQGHSKHG